MAGAPVEKIASGEDRMTLDYSKIINWPFAEVRHSYTVKDAILYALGIGFGHDPMDSLQLPFVFEEADFCVVPTMAVVLAGPGFWVRQRETGIDWQRILHGEQGLVLHRPLPPSGTVVARTRVSDILDKGAGKGALIYLERTLRDVASGERLATLSATTFARGDGGFGGPSGPQPQPHQIPNRAPDVVCDLPTVAQSALIYRLSGDPNPLHVDPLVAAAAGFKAPILHGLCTFGVAGHALMRSFCDYDPGRLLGLKARFSSPVYPGETIRTQMWRDGELVSFRSSVVQRGVVVLNNGCAEIGN
jgi:acyl dehydratase